MREASTTRIKPPVNAARASAKAEQTVRGMPSDSLFLLLTPLLFVILPPLMAVIVRSATGESTPAPAKTQTSFKPLNAPRPHVSWQQSFDAAQAQARQTGQTMMVDFYATWCVPCKEMDEETWTDEGIIEATHNIIPVKVDVDAHHDLALRYQIGALPAVLWINAEGKEKARSVGFTDANEMLSLMQQHS